MEDFVGFGALEEALAAFAAMGVKKPMVVASKNAWARFNPGQTRKFFAERQTTLYSDFQENPSLAEIIPGVEVYRQANPDIIIAIGGGSPIDVAKMIKVIAHAAPPINLDAPETIVPSGNGPPLAAIATTAGSGSEATRFAVFYLGKAKQSLAHPSIRPDFAIVDPEMSSSQPPRLTAVAGLDALAQAVESYWSCSATEESKKYAASGIRYILANLTKTVATPDLPSRYAMAMGAYAAGMAIDLSRTTLPHALAYYLTQTHNLPHGYAVALTLPHFFTLNLEPGIAINHPQGQAGVKQAMAEIASLFGVATPADCARMWRNLMRQVGLKDRLSEVGLSGTEELPALVASINLSRAKNHPVSPTPERLIQAFGEDWEQ